MRADARRNREHLLVAATELFAETGTDVSLEAVAKRAGVGIGTLYRHFPTRDALVEAAYSNEVTHLCDAADELLETLPPDQALAAWMDRFVTYAGAKRGMSEALQSVVASGSEVHADGRRRIVGALSKLLDAGIAAGTIRPDVDAEDVIHAMGAIWLVKDERQWPDQAHKVLRLLMDGLRFGAATG
jgi:AcrR family transcriptional regulator